MATNRERTQRSMWLVVAIVLATFGLCVWIALTVNVGAAVIGALGVAAALWLFASSSGGPPQLIPVFVRRQRR